MNNSDDDKKKIEKEEAGQNTAHVALKGAATYFGGSAGNFAYNKLSNTKLVKGVEKDLGKTIAQSPIGDINKEVNDTGAVNMADQAIDTVGGKNPTSAAKGIGGKNPASSKKIGALQKNKANRSRSLNMLKGKKNSDQPAENNQNEDSNTPENENSESEDVFKKFKKVKLILTIAIPIVAVLLLLLVIVAVIGLIGSFFGFLFGANNTLTEPGTAQAKNEAAYYKKLDEVVDKYRESCGITLDKAYIHTILIYPVQDMNAFFDGGITDINTENGEVDYSTLTGKIETVASLLAKNCNINYEIGGSSYNSVLTSSFFKDYYKELLKTSDADSILTNVFSLAEAGSSLNDYSWYLTDNLKVVMGTCEIPYNSEYLNGTKENSTVGFSDYIKGVLSGEKGEGIKPESKEFLKAFTIVASSYVLARSNYQPGDTEIFVHNGDCWQLSCDIKQGCTYAYDQPNGNGGRTYGTTYTGRVQKENVQFHHGPLTAQKEQLIDEVFNEVLGTVMVLDDGKIFKAKHLDSCQNDCFGQTETIEDAIAGMNYVEILRKYYPNINFTLTNILEDSYADNVNYSDGGYTKKFVYYNQRDYNNNFCGRTNGTISTSGCGVTAMAMVLSTLEDQKYNPVTVMNEAHSLGKCGYGISGTAPSFFSQSAKRHGLKYLAVSKRGNLQLVLNALASGKSLVIAHMGPGTFTRSGHYIVLAKVNNKGQVYVYDPYRKERNGWYNFEKVVAKQLASSGFHIITKE